MSSSSPNSGGAEMAGFFPKSVSKKPIRCALCGRTKSVVWEVLKTGSPVALSRHGTSYTVGGWTETQLRVLDRAPGPGARVDHSRRHDPFIGMGRRVARLGPTHRRVFERSPARYYRSSVDCGERSAWICTR